MPRHLYLPTFLIVCLLVTFTVFYNSEPSLRCDVLAATIERGQTAYPGTSYNARYVGDLLTAIGEYRAECGD